MTQTELITGHDASKRTRTAGTASVHMSRVYDLTPRYLLSSEKVNVPKHNHVLGGTFFSRTASPNMLPTLAPRCVVDFRQDSQQPDAELWYSKNPVRYESQDRLTLAHDGEVLFGVAQFPDSQTELAELTREAYGAIFGHISRLGYPFLFRIWNYLPDINRQDTWGMERYRAFCKGRAQAFFNDARYRNSWLPAGTGIGCASSSVHIAFLASRQDNRVNLENPRQVPAYRYPSEYGPRPPSFARGTLVRWDETRAELFVSGTASVVGHRTAHVGDIEKQCETTLENIEHLISARNMARYGVARSLSLTDFERVRIYVRHEEHVPRVKGICSGRLPAEVSMLYLGGDICRAELLVEIEGSMRLELSGE